jgi:predicted nucleic acid-binding Zn ribbon protein
MKRQSAQTLGEAIKVFLAEQKGFNRKLMENRLVNSWNEIMGATVASYTSNVEIRRQKLYVTLTSSVLRHSLAMSKDDIIRKINQTMGDEVITDVVFR